MLSLGTLAFIPAPSSCGDVSTGPFIDTMMNAISGADDTRDFVVQRGLLDVCSHDTSTSDSANLLAISGPFSFFARTSQLQQLGETTFTAAIVISFIQAALALYQYRSNPNGELIFPPGLTCGVESPSSLDKNTLLDTSSSLSEKTHKSKWKVPSDPLQELQKLSSESDRLLEEQQKEPPNIYTRTLFKINRLMVLLVPWLFQQLNKFLTRNSHMFHIFFIISLASAFDFWKPSPTQPSYNTNLSVMKNLNKGKQKVVVLGDSLAIGIGSVETFDPNKNNTVPISKIEKLHHDKSSSKSDISPVFPQVFAQTLAKRLQQNVQWRSAGVDGGACDDIRTFLLDIIREEASTGHPPDVIVVICGINDLKKSVSNPFKPQSTRAFRQSMEELIAEIKEYAPNSQILFPALPVQMFHKNSVVNILPLSFFLDAIVGFWDSQKKWVSDLSKDVMYVGLTTREIMSWYQDGDDDEGNTLISADGVHPNKRCYAHWALTIGEKYCDSILKSRDEAASSIAPS